MHVTQDHSTKRDMTREIGTLILLLVSIGLAWCYSNDKWTAQEWNLPSAYLEVRESDVVGMLATFKAAAEGHFTPLGSKKIPELGAPGEADWADNPVVEEFAFWITGLLSRSTGLFWALNLKLLIAHLLAGACFYGVARYFGVLRSLAFAGGLAFALAPFIFSESPHHSNVALAWHVPLFLIVWSWVGADRGLSIGSKHFWLAFGIAFLTGLQNIYYTNIFCQLTLLAGLTVAWRCRQWQPVLASLGIIGGAAFAFGLMAIDTLALRLNEGPNQAALLRSYHWLEIYSLKIVDMFVPPTDHHINALADFSAAHAGKIALVNEGSYIGLCGILSLGLLIFISARAAVRRTEIPAEFWQVMWIVLVFTTGGLNSFAGIFGITFFRAGYRAAIVIQAIVLIFLVRKASEVPRAAPLIAALMSAVAFVDQVPIPPSSESQTLIAMRIESDREFTNEMESRLPEDAMVFQLPVMDYPESPAQGITPYEHLRPYLYSRTLRYSFGAVKGRKNANNAFRPDPNNISKLINQLKEYQFRGIYINKNGYADKGEFLISTLQKLGLEKPQTSKWGDLVFFELSSDIDKEPVNQPIN
jgi:phosphoglycerol transferase